MKIQKGTRVQVDSCRKGKYIGVATRDFDTEKDEWYHIAVDQDEPVRGMNTDWFRGDDIPARRGLCKVEPLNQKIKSEKGG